jgi:alpha-beta hydrolase superfamily lysophospholipase
VRSSETHDDDADVTTRLARLMSPHVARVGVERYERASAHGVTRAWRATPRGATRARVLLAHATGNDALYPQVALARALVARGAEVFAFDLDGHGRASTSQLVADVGVATEQIGAAVQAAAGRGGAALPTWIVGTSLGGALTLAWAARAGAGGPGAKVAGIVLVAVPLGVAPRLALLAREARAAIDPAFWGMARDYGVVGMWPALGPVRRGAFPLRVAAQEKERDYLKLVPRLIAELELEQAAAAARSPMTLVYGTCDAVAPVAHGERLAAARGADARLVVVRGATHLTVGVRREGLEAVVRTILG